MIEGLERATRVLEVFSSHVPEWSVTDVARELQLPKTTTWECMRALASLGMLRRTGRGTYRLGWRAFQLGRRARMTSEIAGPALSAMKTLVDEHAETTHLAVRHGRDVIHLEKVQPVSGARIDITRVGERLPATCTAVGKVLLAWLPTDEVHTLYGHDPLTRLTDRSIASMSELLTALTGIRARGYAVDEEEALEGMCSIAAPIRNQQGEATWALSIDFPEFRMQTHAEQYAAAIVTAANSLSLGSPF